MKANYPNVLNNLLGLIMLLLMYALPTNAQVVINEIAPDPGNYDGQGAEWAELYNTSAVPVDVSCYVLTNGEEIVVFPANTYIPANGYLLVYNSNFFACATCNWDPAISALIDNNGTLASPDPDGTTSVDVGTCGCTNQSASGCYAVTWQNGTTGTGDRVILFDANANIADGVYWGTGASQAPAASPIPEITYAQGPNTSAHEITGTAAGCSLPASNNYDVPALPAAGTSDATWEYAGADMIGCTTSKFRTSDGTGSFSGDEWPTPGTSNATTDYTVSYTLTPSGGSASTVDITSSTMDEVTLTVCSGSTLSFDADVYGFNQIYNTDAGDTGNLENGSSRGGSNLDGTGGLAAIVSAPWVESAVTAAGVTHLNYPTTAPITANSTITLYIKENTQGAAGNPNGTTCPTAGANINGSGSSADCYIKKKITINVLPALLSASFTCANGLVSVTALPADATGLSYELFTAPTAGGCVTTGGTTVSVNPTGVFQVSTAAPAGETYYVRVSQTPACGPTVCATGTVCVFAPPCVTSLAYNATCTPATASCVGDVVNLGVTANNLPNGGVIEWVEVANATDDPYTTGTVVATQTVALSGALPAGTPVINEVLFNATLESGSIVGPPAIPAMYGEGWEIAGTPGANIGCSYFTDGDFVIQLPSTATIPADGFYVIGSTSSDASWNANIDLVLTPTNIIPNLTNASASGEFLIMFNASNVFVDGVYWGASTAGVPSPSAVSNAPATSATPSVQVAGAGCAALPINTDIRTAIVANAGSVVNSGVTTSTDEQSIERATDVTGAWQLSAAPGSAVNTMGISNVATLAITPTCVPYTIPDDACGQTIHIRPRIAPLPNSATCTGGPQTATLPAKTFTIGACPTATVSGESAICAGTTTNVPVTITGNGTCTTATITYTVDGGAPVVTAALPITGGIATIPNVSTAGVLVITNVSFGSCGTAACAAKVSGEYTITVAANPANPIASAQEVCNGQATAVTATGGPAINWYSDVALTTLIGSDNTFPYAGTTNTTIYAQAINNDTGCKSAAIPVAITVNPLPTAAPTGGPTACLGTPINFTAGEAAGTSPYTFAWTEPATGGTLTSTTASATSIASAVAGDAGTYAVLVTDSKLCYVRGSQTVTVTAAATTTITGTTSYCGTAGPATPLTATGGGTYAWSTGATTADITPDISAVGSTTYTVTVTATGGCTATASTTVWVNPSVNVCQGSNIVPLTAGCNVTAPYAQVFLLTDEAGVILQIDNVTNDCTASFPTTALTVGTTYHVYALNYDTTFPPVVNFSTGINVSEIGNTTMGCYNAATFLNSFMCYTIVAAPAATLTIPDVCIGEPLVLTATVTTTTTSPYDYAWTPNSANNALDQATPYSVTPTSAATAADDVDYTVTVTDANGCTATATANPVINTLPTADIIGTTAYCGTTPAPSPITATGGGTYAWSPNGETTAAITPTAGLGSTTYTVTVTATNGCTATASTMVCVNPILDVCAGTPIDINAAGCELGVNVLLPDGITLATYNQVFFLTDDAGVIVAVDGTPTDCLATFPTTALTPGAIYHVYALNYDILASPGLSFAVGANISTIPGMMLGCYNKESFLCDYLCYKIAPLPTLAVVTPIEVCAGATLNFSTTPSAGTSPYTFAWTEPATGGTLTTATSEDPTIAGAVVADSGTYTVTVTDATGCTAANTITATVNPVPAVVVTTPITVCLGGTIAMDITASAGTPGYTYSWSEPAGGGTLSSTTAEDPTIAAAVAADAGAYAVTVTDSKTCTAAGTATVVVNTPATVVCQGNATICETQTLTLSGNTVTGATAQTWTTSGTGTFSDATLVNPVYTPSAADIAAGSVTLTLTTADPDGTDPCVAATCGFTLTINPLPTADAGTDDDLCLGGAAVQIGATAVAGNTYVWSPTAGLSNALIANPTAAPTVTTTYTVTVTSAAGCTASDAVLVTVNSLPGVALTLVDDAACVGETAFALSGGTPTGGTYSGTGVTGGNFDPAIAGVGSHTITYTYTDANGCTNTATDVLTVGSATATIIASGPTTFCAGGSVTLIATGGGTYAWSPGGATTSFINATTTGTYAVTVTNNGCTASTSIAVTVNPLPIAPVLAGATYCVGATATALDATTAGATGYAWSNGGTTASITPLTTSAGSTTYTVTVTGTGGCTATASATIAVNSTIVPPALADASYCLGATATALNAATTGATSYAWSNGATTASITPLTTSAGSTTYSVVITGTGGCNATADAVVVVNAIPTADAGTDDDLCLGGAAVQIGATPVAGNTYVWSPTAGLSNALIANPTATPAATTTYTVTVTNAGGCTAADAVVVTVNPLPVVALALADDAACVGETAFALSGGTPTGGTYSGTGVTAGSFNPATAGVGSHTITYTYTDANGCSASATDVLTVSAQPNPPVIAAATYCMGAVATSLDVTVAGATYLWSNGATTASITPLTTSAATTTYTVTVTIGSCTATRSATITVNNCNTGSIGDFVWLDSNNDGSQTGEASAGINGVVVTLTLPDGSTLTTTTTNHPVTGLPGYYTFTGLAPGNYTVTVGTGPNGTALTTPAIDNVVLGAGENYVDADFGFTPLGSIGDYVWNDTNGDGIQDATETGINGVVVTLTLPDGSTVTTTTTNHPVTGLPGYYTFTGLPAGDYIVTVGTGPNGTALTTPMIDNVTLGAGENYVDADFGFAQTGSLGNYVWNDLDGNGQQNEGVGSGLNGISVVLYADADGNGIPDGPAISSTTTANDISGNPGYYQFTDLPAGGYVVQFVAPSGYTYSTTQNGGAISSSTNTSDTDSNIAGTSTGYTGTITLGVGETINTVDAGLVLPLVCEANAGDIPQVELCEGSYPATTPTGWTPDPVFGGTYGPAPSPAADYSFQYFITNDVPAPHTIQVAVAPNTTPTAAIINALTPGVYRLYRVSWKSGGANSGTLQDASGGAVDAGDNVETLGTSAIVDCIDLTYTYVTILGSPAAGASSNSPLCDTRDILLIGSGGTSYAWSGPLGFTSTSQNPSILSSNAMFPGPGSWTYTVTVTNGSCSSTASTVVVINDSPNITISANSPLCVGSSLNLTSNYGNPTGSDIYQWSGPNGFSSSQASPTIANVTAANTGTYTLLVANQYSCSAAATTFVTVSNGPNATISANATCNGSTANLSLSVLNAGGGATYAWSGTGATGTGNTQSITGLAQGNQTYTVTVTNGSGCVSTSTTTVAIPSCFTCNAQAGIASITNACVGSPITATVSGNNTGAGFTTNLILTNTAGTIIYVGPSPIPTQAAGSYLLYTYNYSTQPSPVPAAGMAIAPYATGSVSGGCYDVSNGGAALNIYSGSIAMVDSTGITQGNTGSTSPFYYNIHTILVEGGAQPYDYTWDNNGYVRYDIQYGDTNGNGVPDALITIYYSDNANWACTITDEVTCTDDGELIFTNAPNSGNVDPNPILDIDDYQITPASSASNGSISINVSGGTPCAAPNSYTYQWSGPSAWTGAAAASGAGGAIESISGLPSGWYSVTVTDCLGQTTEGWYWVPRARRGRSKVEDATMGLSAMPNPFSQETTIEFYASQDAMATIEVYAMDGKRVVTLYNDLVKADEVYNIQLSAANLAAGVYTVVFNTDKGERTTHKVVITK